MVLQEGAPPFKQTLHSSTREAARQLSFPFFIKAHALPQNMQQRLEFSAPLHSKIAGAEITGLSVNSTGSESVTIFMQLLDGEGRPSAHPIPLCVLASSNAFSARVQVPLNNPQKVSLLLFSRSAGISAVTVTGRVVLVDGNLQASEPVKTKMQKWMSKERTFESVCKSSAPAPRKRARSSSGSGEEPPNLIFATVTGGDDES